MKRFWKILLVLAVPAAVYLTATLSGVTQAFFPALSALLVILLPLVLGGWFARRFKLGWGLFGAEAAPALGRIACRRMSSCATAFRKASSAVGLRGSTASENTGCVKDAG